MDKKELFDVFNGFSENLIGTLSELDALKKEVQQVLEENARLRIENSRLRELLPDHTEKSGRLSPQGKNHLEGIYREGFHICNDLYGQQRGDGECIFCSMFLDRMN